MLDFSNKFLTILENDYLLGILESRSNISFLFVLISVLVLKLNAFSIADAEFIFVLESKWVYLSVVLEIVIVLFSKSIADHLIPKTSLLRNP